MPTAIIPSATDIRQPILNINELMKKDVEVRTALITASYERAMAYSNLIILAGYAGSFTLWSLTKDYLPVKAAMVVALLLGFSLFVFCGWEVLKMIYSATLLRKTANIVMGKLPADQYFPAMAANDFVVQKQQVALDRFWIVALVLSIPTGFGAALILFYYFAKKLIG